MNLQSTISRGWVSTPNLEWQAEHNLVTPFATINFNVEAYGRRYRLLPESYRIVPSLRVVTDNLAQADGSLLHPRFKTGLVATMTIRFEIPVSGSSPEYEAACGSDLREMYEDLVGALNSIRQETTSQQRLIWTPTGAADRMLDEIQVLGWTDPNWADDQWVVEFSVETPFPCAFDETQTTASLTSGVPATITNGGTSDVQPVIKAYGPFTTMSITNNSALDEDGNPLAIFYDGGRPGAVSVAMGHYAEFDTFKGTVFLDGSSTDLLPGVVPDTSDFWPLVYTPAANSVEAVGCNADVLYNTGWS